MTTLKPKDRTQKTTNEMTLNEFVSWATGHILFSIAEGQRLRDIVYSVIQQTMTNKVFGGMKGTKR